jgi:hypothetical protein
MASDMQARYAAKKIGMRAAKSRWRKNSIDNRGGFQIIDGNNNVVDGYRFDLNGDEVVKFAYEQARLESIVPVTIAEGFAK